MTTWHDVVDIEKQLGHLVGEHKDVKRILSDFIALHDSKARDNGKRKCGCQLCVQAQAWLARNGGE